MKRSKFNLSHFRLTTGDQGQMIPVGCVEVLPGDSFQHSVTTLLRTLPLAAPVMGPVHIKVDTYYIPTRICWDNFESFITGGENGLAAPEWPYMDFVTANGSNVVVGSLADYLGYPVAPNIVKANAIPVRACQLVYNGHVRNPLLQTERTVSKADGVDTTTDRTLFNKNWGNDYFTKASPEPQLGADVTIPLGPNAPVVMNGAAPWATPKIRDASTGVVSGDGTLIAGSGVGDFAVTLAGPTQEDVVYDPNGTLEADLSSATGISIRQLRESIALQKFMENKMIRGSRYSDLLAQWGVRYSDARLQRPEYLGGGRQVLQVSEVLQTGVTTDGAASGPGNLYGHAIGVSKSNAYRASFEEHGYVITFLTVTPVPMYFQGMNRALKAPLAKSDLYTPEFAHVGQQEILKGEIFMDSNQDDVWGYQDRYSQYREHPSTVHGYFRTTFKSWHMARDFGVTPPALNATFLTANPTDRIYQSTASPELQIYVHHNLVARRIVSANSNPGGTL